MSEINLDELGDVAELEAIEAELNKSAVSAVSDTAAAVAEIEANGGIVFPYDPIIEQNVRVFLAIGFGVAAAKYGEHWNLGADDCGRLSVALSQVVERYVPMGENMGVLGNLALVAGGILLPRVIQTKMMSAAGSDDLNQEAA